MFLGSAFLIEIKGRYSKYMNQTSIVNSMTEAFLWGSFAAASLLVGAVIAMFVHLPRRVLGIIMAFGVGVLISAVAFELAEEAFHQIGASIWLAAGLLLGALTFFFGDAIIDRFGGRHRKRASGPDDNNSGAAIVLGSILDGIPESIVLGLGILHGGSVSIAMMVAVFLSNLPEAIGATAGLRKSGWKRISLIGMWTLVVVISGLASLAGYGVLNNAPAEVSAFTLAFSAGALLTMLADTMMPEAYRDSGQAAGIVTTLGFGIAFWISMVN